LHGNSKKKERSPDGSKDENIFDIQQGVAIGIFVKEPNKDGPATIYHADLWGSREIKYERLLANDISNTPWSIIEPRSPFFIFMPQDVTLQPEYEKNWKITEIMPINSTGVKTHRDHFVLDFDQESLRTRIEDFKNLNISDEEIREKYNLSDTRDWKLSQKRRSLAENSEWQKHFTKCLYRPFDFRYYYHSQDVVELPRHDVMRHMLQGENIGFCTNRQVNGEFLHILCSRKIINDCTVSLATRERTYLFPLYLYPAIGNLSDNSHQQMLNNPSWPPGKDGRTPNLSPDFVSAIESCLNLKFISDGRGDLTTTFGPEDVFDYIYSIFYSSTYRRRYADFLKTDFPRVPLTSSIDLFQNSYWMIMQNLSVGDSGELHILVQAFWLSSPTTVILTILHSGRCANL